MCVQLICLQLCRSRNFFLALCLLLAAAPAIAQQAPTINSSPVRAEDAETSVKRNVPAANGVEKVRFLTSREFFLSLSVLLFGIFVIIQQAFIIRNSSFEANDIIKIFGLSFIIVATLFLITSGYSDRQIAPAMGLFGTIAGYILGRNSKSKE